MKILIVDDDPVIRGIISKLVSDMGHEPGTASDGATALEQIKQYSYPVVLLDWMMAGMDGIEVCRAIRAMENENVCYIIMNSAREGSTSISEALKAGANDYITKMTDSIELRARIGVGIRTAQLEMELVELNRQLKYLVRTDGLTGLLNHAAILKELDMELDRGRRDGTSTSVLMLDLDKFKAVNDTYGHQAGDQVLLDFSRILVGKCRSFDRIGRYGGEEFLIVLPRTINEEAVLIAERIRLEIAEMNLDHVIQGLKITCSIGTCSAVLSVQHTSALVSAADASLYKAKEAGRNCVVSCTRKVQ
ncbi:MAG: diguanylate cyclase [Candidatus Fermentibacteraceae bacterium]|nr:diguanylate cyclase [Candidatus Fermentibacteraceae bacterium]